MKTCKTCRHFIVETAPWGACLRWHKGYGITTKNMTLNEVLVEDDEGWGMVVGPNFGCVLHEPKEGEP